MANKPDPLYWQKLRQKSLKEHPLKRTPLKRSGKPIKKRSDKRAKQERTYSTERKKFLAERTVCECGRKDDNGNICQRPATEIQHTAGREGDMLLNKAYWKPINTECHQWEIKHPKEAQETGITIRRNVSISERKSRLNK